MTPHLIWLASYPKSGNTWVRAFVDAYLSNDDADLDLNNLSGSVTAAGRSNFDRIVGIPASDLLASEIDALRPEVFRAMNADLEEPLFLKTHDMWRRIGAGGSLFPADVTVAVVHIVRNPLSVAPSFAHHYGCSVDEAISRMAAPNFTLASQERGSAIQLPQVIGSWSSHTDSWLSQTELPTVTVRYEDLHASPSQEFDRLLTACGFDVDAARLADACDATAFSRLQKKEADRGFNELGVHASGPFFRRGAVDAWRSELTPEQVNRLLNDHRTTMERVGYAAADVAVEP